MTKTSPRRHDRQAVQRRCTCQPTASTSTKLQYAPEIRICRAGTRGLCRQTAPRTEGIRQGSRRPPLPNRRHGFLGSPLQPSHQANPKSHVLLRRAFLGPRCSAVASMQFAVDCIAGCISGVGAVFIGHPLDTIRVRTQTAPHGTSSFMVARDVLKAEGLRGMFRGVVPPTIAVSAGTCCMSARIRSVFPVGAALWVERRACLLTDVCVVVLRCGV